jgi:hypothetical protein
MSSGSKQQAPAPQPTSQTVQQETIPKFLQPYVTDVASRAQALSNRPYTPYQNQRIAGFDPMQLQAQQGLAGLQTPKEFEQAAREMRGLTRPPEFDTSLRNIAGMQRPGELDIAARNIAGMQSPEEYAMARALMQDPGKFGQQEADFYMSPYQSAVTDVAARKMQEEAARQQMQANLGAAKQGTYGGGRQAVLEGMRGRDLMTGMGDLYAQQLQAAFLNAQEQYERDRQARMMSGQGLAGLGTARQTADLNRYGALAQSGLQKQAADLERFGALGDAATRQQVLDLDRINALRDTGLSRQQEELTRLGAVGEAGRERQALDQSKLETAYQDFLRQRDYPMEQLGFYSNIVRGLPAPVSSTSTTYAPTPSTLNQLVGLAGAAASGYSAFNK